MNEYIPPIRPESILQTLIRSEQHYEAAKPHVVYLSQEMYEDLVPCLFKKGLSLQAFFVQACEKIVKANEFSKVIDRKEPHMIMLSHVISRRMKEELEKRHSDFDAFVYEACIEWLKKVDAENAMLDHYLKFSDMQLSPSQFKDKS